MSTLQLLERHLSPFDILFRNHFKADSTFQPATNTKQSHPLNISSMIKDFILKLPVLG